jgi:hypothetical protein
LEKLVRESWEALRERFPEKERVRRRIKGWGEICYEHLDALANRLAGVVVQPVLDHPVPDPVLTW